MKNPDVNSIDVGMSSILPTSYRFRPLPLARPALRRAGQGRRDDSFSPGRQSDGSQPTTTTGQEAGK